jgi:hypothetical protein
MMKAKQMITKAISQTIQECELPAYIIDSILGDIRCDLKEMTKMEMEQEMERNNVDMEQGIHTEKLGEQTVKENPDK